MSDQPELDAETLKKIQEEIEAKFANEEVVLDEETLKQIEAQVEAQFNQGSATETEVSDVEDEFAGYERSTYTPGLFVAPESQQVEYTEEVQKDLDSTTIDEPINSLHEDQTALNIEIQQELYYEEPAQEEVVAAPVPVAASGKKKKMKIGSKTKFSPPSRSATQVNLPAEDEIEEEEEEEIPQTRSARVRPGGKKAKEKPKSKKGLIIGIVSGVVVILIIVVVIIMKSGKKDEKTNNATDSKASTTSTTENASTGSGAQLPTVTNNSGETKPTTETKPADAKPPVTETKVEEKKPEVKSAFSTAKMNADEFRVYVLKFINSKDFEKAQGLIDARKAEFPNEDLGYPERMLKRGMGK